jgi:hypothetical protein
MECEGIGSGTPIPLQITLEAGSMFHPRFQPRGFALAQVLPTREWHGVLHELQSGKRGVRAIAEDLTARGYPVSRKTLFRVRNALDTDTLREKVLPGRAAMHRQLREQTAALHDDALAELLMYARYLVRPVVTPEPAAPKTPRRRQSKPCR